MHHNVDATARINKLLQIRRIQLDELLKFRAQRYDLDRVAHCAGGADVEVPDVSQAEPVAIAPLFAEDAADQP